ncbi:hypothetical protein N2152v2_003162 [Parachlorella kessleri]
MRAALRNFASALSPATSSRSTGSSGVVRAIYNAGAAAVQSEAAAKGSSPAEGGEGCILNPAELDAEMLDVEMDRDEGPEFAVAEGLPLPRARVSPLSQVDTLNRPCDIEYEFDRDDPDAVGEEELAKMHTPRSGTAGKGPGGTHFHGIQDLSTRIPSDPWE